MPHDPAALAMARESLRTSGPPTLSRWRHRRTKNEYMVVAGAVREATLTAEVVYRAVPLEPVGGTVLWVRPLGDFLERFELVADPYPLPQPTLPEQVRAGVSPPPPPAPPPSPPPLTDFGEFLNRLPVRVRNVLDEAGVNSFEALLSRTEHPFEWRNFGELSMKRLRREVKRAGHKVPKHW